MIRVARLLFACTLLSAALPPWAEATFHFMSISEIGVGFFGNPNIQFVELRLDAPGQTNLTNTRLTSFDKDGFATTLLLTPNGVTNGTNGRNILYATTDFQTATGITPDFIIPPGVVSPSGMMCWGAPTDMTLSPQDPSGWDFDKPNNYIDCVAYGSYLGFRRAASGTPTTLTPGDGTKSLTRLKNNSVNGSNDTDFALAVANPCNNANQCAVLAPTPTATPTPAPSATFTPAVTATPTAVPSPGKAQLACHRAVISATNKFSSAHVQALVGCETDRLKGKVIGTCPDAKATAKIAAAQAKRSKVITKACGVLPPADTGFGATCPGYTGSCTAPTTSAAEVSSCVDCAARRAGDELIATVYAAPPDVALLKCQLAFGKTVAGYYRAVAALLAKCEDGVARGKVTAPCPDAKTATTIAAKGTKLRVTLCKACGGKDKLCDGSEDAAAATLGITSCPAHTVPSGAVCGNSTIAELSDAVTCVECLADFESTCATALSAHPTTLPAACQ